MNIYESARRAGKYLADSGKGLLSCFWENDPRYRDRIRVGMLEDMGHGASPVVRAQVAEYLGSIDLDESRALLRDMTEDEHPGVSTAARRALMRQKIFMGRESLPEDIDRR